MASRNPGGTPENLIPLEKGTERTRRISAMGGEATKRKYQQKVDMQFLGERLGAILLMYCEDPKKRKKLEKELGEVISVGELDGQNIKVVDKIMLELAKRALSGEKRAISQILQVYENTTEQKAKDEDNGFVEALGNSTGDWDNV